MAQCKKDLARYDTSYFITDLQKRSPTKDISAFTLRGESEKETFLTNVLAGNGEPVVWLLGLCMIVPERRGLDD